MSKNKEDKNFVNDLHRRIVEVDSAHDFNSMTTIGSKMDSDVSIKCLSFHTDQNSTKSLSEGGKQKHVLLDMDDEYQNHSGNKTKKPAKSDSSCEQKKVMKREIEGKISTFKKKRI